MDTNDNRGFIYAPSLDELKPSEADMYVARMLWHWHEDSKHSTLVLGEPIPLGR